MATKMKRGPGKPTSKPGILAALKWPFDKEEVDSLMDSLKQKGLLDLALDHEIKTHDFHPGVV